MDDYEFVVQPILAGEREVKDQDESRAFTSGITLEARYSTRRELVSIASPGNLAQKYTSSIWGQSVSNVVSSLTAVAASHNWYMPAAVTSSRCSNGGRPGPNAPQRMY